LVSKIFKIEGALMLWPWLFALLLLYLVVRAYQRKTAKRSEDSLEAQDNAQPKIQPWWFWGFHVAFMSFVALHYCFQPGRGNDDYFFPVFVGGMLLYFLFQFIREFFKQHAQYSIKSLLILTFCVAVLCSIYSCFGYHVVFIIVLFASAILSHYIQDRHKQEK
jgi:hypothetical protein